MRSDGCGDRWSARGIVSNTLKLMVFWELCEVERWEIIVSRALRLGIGFVGLIPVMGITSGALVAAGVEGLAVGWLALGVGVVWMALVIWWVRRVPRGEGPSMLGIKPKKDD